MFKLSNNTFLTNDQLELILDKNILPQLSELGKFSINDIKFIDVYFSDKMLGKKRIIYPSFDVTLLNGCKLVFKLYNGRVWLHNSNTFPDNEFLNSLGLSLMNNTFFIQGDIQVQLLLQRANIFHYLPKSEEYMLFTLYHYVQTDELPYVFLEKQSGIEMFFGYFIFSQGSILSIPKSLYYQILNSIL